MTAPAGPIFPVQEPDLYDLGALGESGLRGFHERNRETFRALVCVCYARFLRGTEQRRRQRVNRSRLYPLFLKEVEVSLTAASPLVDPLRPRPPLEENRLAHALLQYLSVETGLTSWQDWIGTGRKSPGKAAQLIQAFCRYVIHDAFRHGAANHASDGAFVEAARSLIYEVNTGAKILDTRGR